MHNPSFLEDDQQQHFFYFTLDGEKKKERKGLRYKIILSYEVSIKEEVEPEETPWVI